MNSSPSVPHGPSPAGVSRRDFLRSAATAGTGAALARIPGASAGELPQAPGPGAVRFAIIGDYGETLPDQTFPIDRVGAMVRSWNPDFVVSVGDNNYMLGEAATADVNIGKNFTGFIYPKSDTVPIQYPYPSGNPPYNRFFPCLGNHDYADVADDDLPTPENLQNSNPYLQYFGNALLTSTAQAPNTTVTFANNQVGQTWTRSFFSGEVEDFKTFSESQNLRFYDVRLGAASGPSSVHLFFLDSNSPTPYGRYSADRPVPNRDGSNSDYVEVATQAAWLKQRLAASTARWKIVILHHPPYNSAPGARNSQYTFARWPFRAWGASAVISGHVHNYERLEMPDPDASLQPMTGTPTIPYMVNGAGGFIPEEGFDPSFVVPGSQVRVAQYGAQLVLADENLIHFVYYDLNGVVRDVRTLYAEGQQGPAQVEFSGREFPVDASAAEALLAVTRLGNSSAPLTVRFQTRDGTATDGRNYVATDGVLKFAAGETLKPISVPLLPPPTPGTGQVPWESLVFSVSLSDPTGGSVGFFGIATVIVVNTVDTPLTNQDLFIQQTYRDLLLREPTEAEMAAARKAIGILDLWVFRTDWLYDLLQQSKATEAVFPAAQVACLLRLSDLSILSGMAAPPSYPDLLNGVTLVRNAASTEAGLVSLSTAFNEGILVVMADKFPGFATDNRLFVEVVYQTLILSLGQAPADADFAYWASRLSNSSDAERSRSRYLMLGRLATESFDPPPASGMTAFNLTLSNGTDVFLGIVVAGLLRIQITYTEFLNGYLLTARLLGPVGIRDIISNLLQSAGYAARFRVTSYEGYIDSVKGGLSAADRLPDADPEGDGLTNLEEYSFALVPGRGDREAITELEILDEGGQRFGIFSFRSAKNIQRVEVLVQVSTDLQNWTVVGDPLVDGGEDLGGYIRRRIRIPIESSVTRKYFRVQVRLRS